MGDDSLVLIVLQSLLWSAFCVLDEILKTSCSPFPSFFVSAWIPFFFLYPVHPSSTSVDGYQANHLSSSDFSLSILSLPLLKSSDGRIIFLFLPLMTFLDPLIYPLFFPYFWLPSRGYSSFYYQVVSFFGGSVLLSVAPRRFSTCCSGVPSFPVLAAARFHSLRPPPAVLRKGFFPPFIVVDMRMPLDVITHPQKVTPGATEPLFCHWPQAICMGLHHLRSVVFVLPLHSQNPRLSTNF